MIIELEWGHEQVRFSAHFSKLAGCANEAPLIANKGLDIPNDEIDPKKVEALSGSGLAAFQLYNYYDVVLLKRKEGLHWVTISAANGYPSGMYALGFLLAEANDSMSRTRAKYWLEKADEHGVTLAKSVLRRLKSADIPVALPSTNPESGVAPQIANKGIEIPEDKIESTELEALSGSGIAAFRLFDYYEIVSVDKAKSLYWATISAENGYPGGMYALGFKLAKENDHKSRVRARYWLEKAKQNGESLADDILKRLDEM